MRAMAVALRSAYCRRAGENACWSRNHGQRCNLEGHILARGICCSAGLPPYSYRRIQLKKTVFNTRKANRSVHFRATHSPVIPNAARNLLLFFTEVTFAVGFQDRAFTAPKRQRNIFLSIDGERQCHCVTELARSGCYGNRRSACWRTGGARCRIAWGCAGRSGSWTRTAAAGQRNNQE